MAVRPAEYFYGGISQILAPYLRFGYTFVIFAFFTSTAFFGAIVRAPFFGPRTVGFLPLDAVEGFFDLIAPCAMADL
jgi:hypothetical protein